MQELESPLQINSDKVIVAEIQKEYTLKKQITKQRGLTLYAVYPFDEYKVKKVTIVTTAMIGMDKEPVTQNRATFDPDAFYVWSINERRAVEKVKKHIEKALKRHKEVQQHYATKSPETIQMVADAVRSEHRS